MLHNFENKNFYCAPLSTFFAYSFSKNVELSAKVGLNAGHEGSSPFINSALKFTASKKQADFDMDFGFLIRAGGAKNKPFEPYGADNGYEFHQNSLLQLPHSTQKTTFTIKY